MKLAITGKGGVGKTTFAAIISRLYAEESYNVLAVDADPDANLALALGFPQELISSIVPIAEMKDLVKERTNSSPGTYSTMFKLNPIVDDIPQRYCKEHNGVKLLTMGTVDLGGGGCFCPENVLIKRLFSHLVLQSKDVVILDMEAGLEHIGRGTGENMDAFIVVVEPGIRSIQTYHHVKKLAKDIGIEHVLVVANKVKSETDQQFILEHVEELLGAISFSQDVGNSDRFEQSPYEHCAQTVDEIRKIKQRLEAEVHSK